MKRLFILLAVFITMTQAIIVQAGPDSQVGFQCYGAAREFWAYKGPEAILAGPYETGKTIAVLHKFHVLHAKYGGSRGLMVRKTYTSLVKSAVVTYENKVLPYPPSDPHCMVEKYGGEKPEFYTYPNGSRIELGGLDNPGKFLSAEFDFIYVNQAEELTLNDWELLTGRATGRAGNAPYSQTMGDCNPAGPNHYILKRPRIKVFYSRHEDNPTLYNPTTRQITERGKTTMEALDALTGVRYKRGRQGQWVSAEGQVYDGWDPAIHLIARFDIGKGYRLFRVIDFGYTNPFVCQWWAMDHDGRLYRYREIYRTQRLVEDHAEDIKALTAGVPLDVWKTLSDAEKAKKINEGEQIEATITDHDAEDRATLERHGIPTIAAEKDISLGLQAVAARLRIAGDSKPRLAFMRDSLVEADQALLNRFKPTQTEDEFALYVWPQAKDGKVLKEVPVDDNNHGMDALRYIVMHLQGNRQISFDDNPFYGGGWDA